MRFAALLLVPLLGCSTLGGDDSAPILRREVYGEDGRLQQVVQVTLDASQQGRGCQLLEVSPEGEVSFWQQQDGSSDWSTIRGLVAVLPETVTAALAIVSGPFEIVRDLIGSRPPMAEPSALRGCEGLIDEAPAEEESPGLLNRILGR